MSQRRSNVRPFAELGLADLEEVGGKNSSLGEMVSNLSVAGRPGARRFRHDGRRVPSLHRRHRAGGGDLRAAARTSTPTTPDALAEVGRAIRESVADQRRSPRISRPTSARRTTSWWPGATTCPSPCAPARPPRTCPTPRSPVSRRPSSTSRASTACCRRSARCSRRSTTTGRSPTACTTTSTTTRWRCRPACSRWCAPTSGASGVMFTMDTESGFKDAVFVTSPYGLGEAVVQGAVNPDEFYVYKPALRDGRPAVLKRGVGTKATKMIYTDDPAVGSTTEFVDTEDVRASAAQPHRRRGRGAGPARADDRGALRPADGHRVGQGRHRRAALHPPGPPRDGDVALEPASGSASSWTRRARSSSRVVRSARRSAPAACG